MVKPYSLKVRIHIMYNVTINQVNKSHTSGYEISLEVGVLVGVKTCVSAWHFVERGSFIGGEMYLYPP